MSNPPLSQSKPNQINLKQIFKTEILLLPKSKYTTHSSNINHRLKPSHFKSKQERFNDYIKNNRLIMKDNWTVFKKAAGQIWVDRSMKEWDSNDYRIYVYNLGNEVTDDVLTKVFIRFPSFLKAKVVKDKKTNKSKGFGFVSLKNEEDFVKAMKEINEKVYIGNRPARIMRSKWKERTVKECKSKLNEWHFGKNTRKEIEKLEKEEGKNGNDK